MGPIAASGPHDRADPRRPRVHRVGRLSTTAEEMPVNETLRAARRTARRTRPPRARAVFLNGLYPDRFSAADAAVLGDAIRSCPVKRDRAAIQVALAEHRRAEAQHEQEQRLQDAFGNRLIVLPFLFAAEIDRTELELLARELGDERRPGAGRQAHLRLRRRRRSRQDNHSAAIALGMAARGLKVVVVTIDPARRLANALGLEELGNEPRLVAPDELGGTRAPRRALGDDARPQAHIRRADRAARTDAGARRRDQAQQRLSRAVGRRVSAHRSSPRSRSFTSWRPRPTTTCWCSTRLRRTTPPSS